MQLSLLWPTRNRAKLFAKHLPLWQKKNVELLVGIDREDLKDYPEYNYVIFDGPRLPYPLTFIPEDTGNLVTAISKQNKLATLAAGDWLFFIADDLVPTEDWFSELFTFLSNFDPTKPIIFGALKDSRPMITHPICSRAFYLQQGFFAYPGFLHATADVDLWLQAKCEDAFYETPDHINKLWTHENPYVDTNIKWDDTYCVGSSILVYKQGSEVLRQRIETYYKVKYPHKKEFINEICDSQGWPRL